VGETDGARKVTITFVPPTPGRWTAQAGFIGNELRAEATSKPVSFNVLGKDGCKPLCLRDLIIPILTVVLLFAILIILLRRRRV
jgi:hypothetical protein